MPNYKKIAEGLAKLISNANVSTTTKKRITAAAERGLTPRQVAELVVRNEEKAAKALAAKGIKTKPKRYQYQGTGYSNRELDAAFRASPEEGSAAAMARRMAAENPETVARKAAERARVTMARNRAETVARTAKKKELTKTPVRLSERKPAAGPLTKKAAIRAERNRRRKVELSKTAKARARVAELAEQRSSNPTDVAKVAARVRPPAGYSGAKVVKPRKRAASKPVDTSVKVVKPGTKRTPQEIKDAKEAARQRRIKANARGKITGKDSVTKPPAKSTRTELKERPRTQAEMRLKTEAQKEKIRIARLNEKGKKDSKGRAERERDVDDQEVAQGYWRAGTPKPRRKRDKRSGMRARRVWVSTADDVGIPARSTRTGNTIVERSPKVREDLPPKDELTAIKKAFAELTKEEKEAMSVADARAIQGILREKIAKGPNRKPAGPKDAPTRKYVPPSRHIETAKARIRLQRKKQIENSKKEIAELNKRLIKGRRRLTPAQAKAVAEAIAQVRRNSK